VAEAVPGADITVVRLRAPVALLHERLRRREAGDPSWYLDAATRLAESLEVAAVDDHVVDNYGRPVEEVAAEVLRVAGWPG